MRSNAIFRSHNMKPRQVAGSCDPRPLHLGSIYSSKIPRSATVALVSIAIIFNISTFLYV